MKPKADFVKARIAASKFLEQYSFSSPDDIRIEDIAMDQGLLIRETTILGSEARLVHDGKNGIISVKAGGDLRRKRFAIAHELGHWILHRDSKALDFCNSSDLFFINDNHAIESEANVFASEILMPRSLFQERAKNIEPCIDAITELSNLFHTSFTATAIRFVEFNKQNCFIAFSKDGLVKWFHKKTYGSELWIDQNHLLHKQSMAWSCLKNGIARTSFKTVGPECWFSEIPSNMYVTVREQSMKLGESPYIISLLLVSEEEKGDFLD